MFERNLKKISQKLTDRDYHVIKFLCRDKLRSKIDTCDLFKQSYLFNEQRQNLLLHLLYHAGRYDLLQVFDKNFSQVQQDIVNNGSEVSNYRLLLHNLCERLSIDEFQRLKAKLPSFCAKHIYAVTNMQLFFKLVESSRLVNETDLDRLIIWLQAICREDLVLEVQTFQAEPDHYHKHTHHAKVPDAEDDIVQYLTAAENSHSRYERRENTYCTGPVRHSPPQQHSTHGRILECPSDAGRTPFSQNIQRMADERQDSAVLPLFESGPMSPPAFTTAPVEITNISDQDEEIGLESISISSSILPRYEMNRTPSGFCLIINIMNCKEMPERRGSDLDAKMLYHSFTRLNFSVLTFEDLDKRAILYHIASYCNHVQDCFVCCILSHGNRNSVLASDKEKIKIDDLLCVVSPQKCPNAAKTPKLFFLQACQGSENQPSHPHREIECDAKEDSSELLMDGLETSIEYLPITSNVLIGYATTQGYAAYRHPRYGSWYIRELTKNLDKYAPKYDIMTILTRVNNDVCQANARMEDGVFKQAPAPQTMLTKQLYFRLAEQRITKSY